MAGFYARGIARFAVPGGVDCAALFRWFRGGLGRRCGGFLTGDGCEVVEGFNCLIAASRAAGRRRVVAFGGAGRLFGGFCAGGACVAWAQSPRDMR